MTEILFGETFKFFQILSAIHIMTTEGPETFRLMIELNSTKIAREKLQELRLAFMVFFKCIDFDVEPFIGFLDKSTQKVQPYISDALEEPEYPGNIVKSIEWTYQHENIKTPTPTIEITPPRKQPKKPKTVTRHHATQKNLKRMVQKEENESDNSAIVDVLPEIVKEVEPTYDDLLEASSISGLSSCFSAKPKQRKIVLSQQPVLFAEEPMLHEFSLVDHVRISRRKRRYISASKIELPLESMWSLSFIDETYSIKPMIDIQDVPTLWRYLNNLGTSGALQYWSFWRARGSPMRESPENVGGGRLRMSCSSKRSSLSCLDRWKYIIMWMLSDDNPSIADLLNGTVIKQMNGQEGSVYFVWFKKGFTKEHLEAFTASISNLSERYNLGWTNNRWHMEQF